VRLFCGGFQSSGREGRHFLIGAGWESFEELLEVGVGFEPMMTAVLDNGVEDGTAPTGFCSSNEEEVLFTNGSRAHGIFNLVVINLNESIFNEDTQSGPLPEGVGDGLAKEAFGEVMATFLELEQDAVKTF